MIIFHIMSLKIKLDKLISQEDLIKFSYFRAIVGNQKITLVKRFEKVYCYDQDMNLLEIIKINNDSYVFIQES